jgi:site-specific DNA-methyltransferase (adenine-specific)
VKKDTVGAATLYHANALEILPRLAAHSVDLAIADPPYGAAARGDYAIDPAAKLPRFGGAWNLHRAAWDEPSYDNLSFSLAWLEHLKRIVRPTGSIWIHCTYHNAGFINVACQLLGLEIINEVVWFKRNAVPNLSCRRLTASHETILWVHTGGKRRSYRFNYGTVKKRGYDGDALKQPDRQMRTVWDIPNNKAKQELEFGRHPTQKPLRLLERMLDASGCAGGTLLAPFTGSGSEMIAALRAGMSPVGIELDAAYYALALRRVRAERNLARNAS